MKLNNNISAGFVGYGKQAQVYSKVFNKINVKINSIYVRDKKKYEKFKKLHNISFIYNDLNSFLNKKYDFIFVLLPWNLIEKFLPDIIKNCKCKFIFTEKPVALSKKKLTYLIKLQKKFKKKIFVTFNRRFYFTSKYIKSILKKNKIKKFSMEISEKENLMKILFKNKIKGNIRYHTTSHWIDLIMWLFNLPSLKVERIIKNYILSCKGKYHINIDYEGSKPIQSSLILNNKIFLTHKTLEKLIIYKNNKKIKTIYEKRMNIFKPGILNTAKEIKNLINKKIKKTDLPTINELVNLYKILAYIKK